MFMPAPIWFSNFIWMSQKLIDIWTKKFHNHVQNVHFGLITPKLFEIFYSKLVGILLMYDSTWLQNFKRISQKVLKIWT